MKHLVQHSLLFRQQRDQSFRDPLGLAGTMSFQQLSSAREEEAFISAANLEQGTDTETVADAPWALPDATAKRVRDEQATVVGVIADRVCVPGDLKISNRKTERKGKSRDSPSWQPEIRIRQRRKTKSNRSGIWLHRLVLKDNREWRELVIDESRITKRNHRQTGHNGTADHVAGRQSSSREREGDDVLLEEARRCGCVV